MVWEHRRKVSDHSSTMLGAAAGLRAGLPLFAGGTGFSRNQIGVSADAARAVSADDFVMRKTYGVIWQEGMLPLGTGTLELLSRGMRFEGSVGSHPTVRNVGYEGVAGVRVGRAADRIEGRPTVVLERRIGLPITIATVPQSSLVGEIAERLAALQLGPEATRRTALVVPLKQGAHPAVRALLAEGPPFDPEQMTGLDRHEVFLTSQEAVFLFESQLGVEALEPLLAEPELWRAAAAWRDHLAGPPRLAEDVFSWTRADSIP
jgi:hypothetical protein